MNKQTEFDPRDLVIHFRDLVLYVALRWRSILLVALAGAVLLGGFTYWRDMSLYGATTEKTEVVTPAEPDDEGLARVATVQNYRAAYASLCAYNQSAPMMSIDAMAVHTRRMSYLVTGDCAYTAATLYSKSLASQELYADLNTKDETPPAYLAELLNVKLTYETVDSPAHCVFLDVEIVAPTKALCKQLSNLVRETVTGLTAPVKEVVGEHKGEWAFDRYVVAGSEAVRTRQLDSLKQQKQLQTDLAAAEGALTAGDRAYLNRLEKQEVEPDADHPAPKPDLNVKMVVLGFIAGFALLAMWHALRYLFCGRVLSENDLLARHNAVVFGSLKGEKKRCFVDGLLCRLLQDKDADESLLAQQVALSAVSSGKASVCLVGDLPTAFAEELSKNNISAQVAENPARCAEGMHRLAESDGMLLAVHNGVTRHADVAYILTVAKTLDCPVLGIVIQK